MNSPTIILTAGLGSVCIIGCTSISGSPVSRPVPEAVTVLRTPSPQKPKPRQWNKAQLSILRTFALQESPELWQTVQTLRAERESRTARLKKLREELVDFGRNPDIDPDYVALKEANDGLLDSLNAIFAKLEDAYIAYKKFEATPGQREYGDFMRKTLTEGLQEATEAEKRYLQMSRTK